MENEYISSDRIKEIKTNIDNDNYLNVEIDNYIDVLLYEVEFFVKNVDYSNKLKNHIETNYSKNTINPKLLFYGDIAYHNYHFLIHLQYVLNEFYDNNSNLDNENVEKGIEFIYDKIRTNENECSNYFNEPIFTKITTNPEPTTPALNSNTAPTEKYLGQPTNKKANEFFDFLIEYYRPEDKTQIKYVNILYYLKNDADKNHFIFRVKQSEYKILVIEKTGIDIKKFAKSERYTEEEKPIFNTLENTFLKNKAV